MINIKVKNMGKISVLILGIGFFIISACDRLKSKLNPSTPIHTEGTIEVDGVIRSYLINLPPKYAQSPEVSLVIGLHGGGGSAIQMEKNYFLSEKANKENFAIIYPEGVKSDGILGVRTWNAGTCCAYAVEKQIDDVKFINLLIDEILKKYPKINPKKVYATGMSNGAMMCYRLACELSNKIAAIAPVAGAMVTTNACTPQRSVPILHIHSVLDEKVPYEGGISTFGFTIPPIEQGINQWLNLNSCKINEKSIEYLPKYTHTKWSNCNNGTIEIYLTKDGGHSWPKGEKVRSEADEISQAINANDLIWDFFKTKSL